MGMRVACSGRIVARASRPCRCGNAGAGGGPGFIQPVFRHKARREDAICADLALRKVHFVAQPGFNYAEMSVLKLTPCYASLCFHTYPRIDLHFSFFLTQKLRRE